MSLSIFAKIVSVLLLSDVVRGQSLLAKRFNISGPVFEYDSLEFTMDFEVSDFIQDSMIGYSLYDGLMCKDGNDNDITENEGYLLSRIRTDSTPLGDGTGVRKIKVQSEVNPSDIENTPIYREDEDGNVVLEYCVRFGVYNKPIGEEFSMESNFIESPIKLVIDLKAGFSVDAQLSNLDTVLTAALEDTAVEAYICDSDDNVVPILPTNQGQTVRVCVSPTPKNLALGVLIKQLEEFTFRRESPVRVEQAAIKPNTGGVAADQLTVVSCRPGSTVCAFETLLSAEFFMGEGFVVGQGTAFLQIGTSPTAESRRLEASPESRRLEALPNEVLGDRPTAFTVLMNMVPVEEDYNLLDTTSGGSRGMKTACAMGIVFILSALVTLL